MSPETRSAVGKGTRRARGQAPGLTFALASAAAGMCVGTAQAQEADKPQYVQLEDVVVVGSRLQRPAEAGDGHAPITVFNQEDIVRLGVTNIADVLDYLPQQPFSSNEQTLPGGARIVQLRGLTVGNTLVLINGRRAPISALLGAGNAYNMNTIPLSAVERIEVLADSASAVYGADAVGGVINVVLKKSIAGPGLDLYYGTADGGADERRASLGYGSEGERYRFAVTADYFDRDYLLGTERLQTNNQDFRSQGGADFRTAVSDLANISTVNNANLPGLTSPRATVPVGSTGVGLTPASFAATQGQVNLTSTAQYRSIVPKAERKAATALGDFDITSNLKLFSEFIYSKQEDESRALPNSIPAGVVPANNPYNPFGVDVRVGYLFVDGPTPVNLAESELFRGVAGMRGTLGSSWDWEVSVLDSAENGDQSTINSIDIARATAALRSTNPATALNVFSDGTFDQALLDSLRVPQVVNHFSSDAVQTTAFIRGSLFDLPAGRVSVVFGGEQRKEIVHVESNTATVRTSVTADRDVMAGFTEARIPLVADDMGVPLVKQLAITLAARYDDYSDFGNTTNPQYGLEYTIVPSLLLRASYGDSFRAPSLFELNQSPTTGNGNVADPRRGNVPSPFQFTAGGNPNLQPEKSTTFATGLVFTPDVAFKPRATVTYWKIQQEQRLQRLNQLTLLANEAFFPNLVVRDTPTAADLAAGQPGRLLSLNLTAINAGSLDTDGFDMELSARWQTDWGNFTPTLSGTRITSYEAADLPTSPVVDRLGVANTQGSIPKLRARGSIAWEFHGYGIAPTVRYVSSYDDTTTANVRTGTRVDSQVQLDLQASLNFETAFGRSTWSQGLALRLGMMNLLDEDAPFAQVGGAQGVDPGQGELRGRFGYAMLTKSF